MIAVVFRLRSLLRRGWLSTVAMTFAVGLVGAVPLTVAAGAHRTTSAPSRYLDSIGGAFDAMVTQEQGGLRHTSDIAALPGIVRADSSTFIFGGLIGTDGSELIEALVFGGSSAPSGLRMIDGRQPRGDQPGEFVATKSFTDLTHSSVGDRFTLLTLTQEQADVSGFAVDAPEGPTVPAVLTGVLDGPSELDDTTPSAYFSPALLDLPVGTSQTNTSVVLREGTTLDELRSQLDQLPGSESLNLAPADLIDSKVRRAVDAQSTGLWLLALVATVASVAVLGQLTSRSIRARAPDGSPLIAIGYTRRQLLLEGVGRAAVPIGFGCVLAALVAVLSSTLFPTGFVRHLEPHRGISVDVVMLVLGLAIGVVALLAWTVMALMIADRAPTAPRPSRLVDVVASQATSATFSTGVRFAFGRRGRERSAVAAALVGVLVTVAGMVGALVFGASLDRLVREPGRYGSNYDYIVSSQGADSLAPEIADTLRSDPDLSALTYYAVDHARVGSLTIELLATEKERGDSGPQLLSGRLPSGADEIAFGRVTARAAGARVGEDITLDGPSGPVTYHVTGLAVVPGLGPNEGLGEGGVLTVPGLRRLNPQADFIAAVVQSPVDDATIVDRLTEVGGAPPSEPFRPSAIVNVARVRSIPFVVAGFLGVLAMMTIAHVVITSLRGRRRDLAICRALGADANWISRAVHWQATALTVVAVALGVPLGIIVGRTVFVVFANSMGALNGAAIPLAFAGLIAVGFTALANASAVLPAIRARRMSPAHVLQVE